MAMASAKSLLLAVLLAGVLANAVPPQYTVDSDIAAQTVLGEPGK